MPGKFDHLPPLTDEEEAAIQREITDDADAPELTGVQLAQARPFGEALPALAVAIKRSRGRPPVEHPKEHISLRLSPDVVERFKASGPGWQGRMDALLQRDLAELRKQHLTRIGLLQRGLDTIQSGQRFYRVLPGHKIAELEGIVAMLERDAALS